MENTGLSVKGQPRTKERERQNMYTVSDIVADVDRGCMANNMVEDKFSYRIIFYINEKGKGTRHYIDTPYSGIKKVLKNIIRKYLSLTNTVVIAEATALKDGKCIRLLSRSYAFSLDAYFKRISGDCGDCNGNRNIMYNRYAVR